MGEAAGKAAHLALSTQRGCAEVQIEELQAALESNGVFLGR
jgi:hypothetical protein